MLVSSRFLRFHVTLLPYLTVKWLLRRYSKVIGHWLLASFLTKLLPTSLSLHGDSLELVTSVTIASIFPSGLTGYHPAEGNACPALTVTYSFIHELRPSSLFDDLYSVTVLFCFDAQIVSDLATGSLFVHVSLAFGMFSAISKQSLTSWQHRIVLVSAWSQPFLQGPLVPLVEGGV